MREGIVAIQADYVLNIINVQVNPSTPTGELPQTKTDVREALIEEHGIQAAFVDDARDCRT